MLLCHYCDFSMPLPQTCPECSGYTLSDIGLGTERVEEVVRSLFPKARVARMDRDTTRKKGSHGRIIDAVESGDVDILIGTKMIAKGHHFPRVTLVGIISGDTALHIPDFRGAERSFQMITQAAGRSGRGSKPGRVVVQSYDPDNPCFNRARRHDYEGFFNDELPLRKEVVYPPFTRLACIRVEGNREEQVVRAITEMKRTGEKATQRGIDILGPAPAFLARLKGKHRWQMLIKGEKVRPLHAFLANVKAEFDRKKYQGVTLTIDVDPVEIS
ncbi:MAG: primosomal protein N' [Thermodesulfobacteriota bacterium]